jgi:hypothetical protein
MKEEREALWSSIRVRIKKVSPLLGFEGVTDHLLTPTTFFGMARIVRPP